MNLFNPAMQVQKMVNNSARFDLKLKSVQGDFNPQALASGLSPEHMQNYTLTCLLHQIARYLMLNIERGNKAQYFCFRLIKIEAILELHLL